MSENVASDMCHPAKIYISLHIHTVWSESLMSQGCKVSSCIAHDDDDADDDVYVNDKGDADDNDNDEDQADNVDSDQTVQMHRLILVFVGTASDKANTQGCNNVVTMLLQRRDVAATL